MADLSRHISNMFSARTGYDIRMPLSRALTMLYEEGKNASTLNYQPDTYYAKQVDMASLLPISDVPEMGSTRLIKSNSIRLLVGDIEHVDWDADIDIDIE